MTSILDPPEHFILRISFAIHLRATRARKLYSFTRINELKRILFGLHYLTVVVYTKTIVMASGGYLPSRFSRLGKYPPLATSTEVNRILPIRLKFVVIGCIVQVTDDGLILSSCSPENNLKPRLHGYLQRP